MTSGEKRRPRCGTGRGHDDDKGYLAGARAAVPFALATAVLGISFGVLARSLGWGVAATVAFSLITFSGSAQFAVAAVFGTGGGALAAVAAAVLLNARFLAMGIAIAPSLKGGRLRRVVEGQAVVDASWALASRGDGRFDREHLIGATVPQYATWVVGTAMGVLAGDMVGDVERLGLDAIFPAFFLVLLVEELRSGGRRAAAVALLAAAPERGVATLSGGLDVLPQLSLAEVDRRLKGGTRT